MTSEWVEASGGSSPFEESFRKEGLNLASAAKKRQDLLDFVDGIGIASFSLSVIEKDGKLEKRCPVSHRFSSVEGLYESVYEIAENLEGVILAEEDGASGNYPKVIRMQFSVDKESGVKEVFAKDLSEFCAEHIKVVNPEHRIMRLARGTKKSSKQFELDLEIRRYSNEPMVESSEPVQCDIPLKPRVNVVTRCSVQEDEKGIILLILTNGSLKPEEVLKECEARKLRQSS